MNRILLFSVAGVAATVVAATPAVAGLSGNRSFSHNLPVRVPSAARTVQFADEHHPSLSPTPTHGSPTATVTSREPGEDRPADHSADGVTPTGTAAPTSRHETEPGDDHPGDRHGDATPTPTRTSVATTTSEPGDRHGGKGNGSGSGNGGGDGGSDG